MWGELFVGVILGVGLVYGRQNQVGCCLNVEVGVESVVVDVLCYQVLVKDVDGVVLCYYLGIWFGGKVFLFVEKYCCVVYVVGYDLDMVKYCFMQFFVSGEVYVMQ